ncbi:3-hydroxyisobutyrate dehydrogenase [Virgisporangium aliadipatigenens]|uniref:3-hydroxyisobutyrate dehydrogenase n=2 Tax=Virgisporangium aliadipatigenens TaxID=741659 RepID=A0A8J4DTE4_9ACTN|nr:3-hydroxyisobutyrate dehydrogenase [Virgisporangium aliadipatigenens]
MGTALAGALLSAGYRTTVWNRTPGRSADLVARGAAEAESATAAVLASPLVLVTLLDYDGVAELLTRTAQALPGRTVVNLTTGTPDQARAMAARWEERGARYVDGAMMAVPQTVATPEAFFLYSGSREGFESHRHVLDRLAAGHYLGPDPAAAELWDTALLGSGYAALTGFLHGAALLDTVGVPAARFVPLVTQWLEGIAAFMTDLATEIDSGAYAESFSPVGMNRIAVANIVGVSRSQGVDAEVHAPLRALLDRRVADGHGDDSFASLFELLRSRAAPWSGGA